MLAKFHEFFADNSGATIIKYGLIAAGIALAVIAAVYKSARHSHPGFAPNEHYNSDGAIIYKHACKAHRVISVSCARRHYPRISAVLTALIDQDSGIISIFGCSPGHFTSRP